MNNTYAVPYAVFTYPQVGAVGMTERDAIQAGKNILVGRAVYGDTAKGYAIGVEDSLVKVVVDKENNRILGCRVAGPDAPLIVQQAVLLMNADLQSDEALERSQLIHPTLSEALAQAFSSLQSPGLLEVGKLRR